MSKVIAAHRQAPEISAKKTFVTTGTAAARQAAGNEDAAVPGVSHHEAVR
ncbi:hypothetical protein [Actinophytocola algeriensis]|uniref:Uncharacterized protein n=1 Tax=Actinophytocola algeriensis TaxID=1768010 RepID=A0A7W7VIH4_9PSEU|nr:hypothetical protein [Actinophytocola algeriensis]MBB4911443.1 hypothetical protein [Actinophytocola algeriensis]MBE1479382.1 hypothetical protein [Actinophytocola algeriensis]